MSTMKMPAGAGGLGLGWAPFELAPHTHSITTPVALQVHKRGRWCTVAKITHFEGSSESLLATVWRKQHGTADAISMPTVVLDYAKQRGVRRFYLRDDHRLRMWWCDLALFGRGRLRGDGERYIPLAWLEETRWREWAYAEETLQLEQTTPAAGLEQPPAGAVQLALFGVTT